MKIKKYSGIFCSEKHKVFEIQKNRETEKLVNEKNIAELRKHMILVDEFLNIVPDVYLASLATNMVTIAGSLPVADKLRISYIAVGTSNTVPNASDTTLGAEVFRAFDTQASSAAIAKNAILIGFGDANGNTLEEVGGFAGDASVTLNSGTLASRSLFTTSIIKDGSKSIFIEITHTFSRI